MLFFAPKIRNFWRVCSQFWLSVRNSVHGPFVEIQEEIHYFVGWEGGGLRGTNIVNRNYVNKLAFPILCRAETQRAAEEGGKLLSASSKPPRICTAPFEWGQTAVVPSERVQIWACLFLYGRSLPRCEATNLGVFVLCHFALISPYSNGAVQIRVGLELADLRLLRGAL